jgi:hypothetical protein
MPVLINLWLPLKSHSCVLQNKDNLCCCCCCCCYCCLNNRTYHGYYQFNDNLNIQGSLGWWRKGWLHLQWNWKMWNWSLFWISSFVCINMFYLSSISKTAKTELCPHLTKSLEIRSWNQAVQSNQCKVSCARELRLPPWRGLNPWACGLRILVRRDNHSSMIVSLKYNLHNIIYIFY